MSLTIENALEREDWKGARQLIRAARRQRPDSHWLVARLALTYYEEHDYERALEFDQKAAALAPRCPLVLWDLAGTFDMLERHRDAIAIYRRLIRRGVESIAFSDCGEGFAWARGLVADCWYRLARCQSKIGRRADAVRCYQRHVAMRGPGCRSISPLREVRKEFADYAGYRLNNKNVSARRA